MTKGNLRAEKGKCFLYKEDVYHHAGYLKLIVISPTLLNKNFDFDEDFKQAVEEYKNVFKDELYISASRSYNGDDLKKLYRISELSKRYEVPMIATNDVHYHHPGTTAITGCFNVYPGKMYHL